MAPFTAKEPDCTAVTLDSGVRRKAAALGRELGRGAFDYAQAERGLAALLVRWKKPPSPERPIVAVPFFWHGQRMKRPAFLLMLFLMACKMESPCDEVARTNSPDGQTSAVLFETSEGATTSYGYLVELSDWSDQDQAPVRVGQLYGAVRSDCAYGVDVGWTDPETLTLTVESAEQINVPEQVSVGGKSIRILVRTGIKNDAAPCGAMAVNR